MVLCVGAGNHFAIEVTHGDSRCGGCSEVGEAAAHGPETPAADAGGKCPCVDIPLGTSSNLSPIRSKSTATVPGLTALDASAQATLPAAAQPRSPTEDVGTSRPPPALGRSSPLSHLRVVILLI
jgi:hypothetical protein